MNHNTLVLHRLHSLSMMGRGIDRTLAALAVLTNGFTTAHGVTLERLLTCVREIARADECGYLEHSLLYDVGQLATAGVLGLHDGNITITCEPESILLFLRIAYRGPRGALDLGTHGQHLLLEALR